MPSTLECRLVKNGVSIDTDHERLKFTIFQSTVNGLEKTSLLRIHTRRLSRGDGKERRIEGGDVVFNKMSFFDVYLGRS